MDETSTSSAPSQAIEMVESSSMASPQKRPRMDDSHGDERVSRRGRNGRGSGNPRARGDRGGSKKKTDMGRAQWSRNTVDKRARNEEAAKRRKDDGERGKGLALYATQFTKEEIESETKKPKRKVAVLIGYSGSGYKGMQLNYNEKTIEGDLFAAMVTAGAISKANADDPKKSSLIRCARTDKGVHAAGNVISLKLIIEDDDIVEKINKHLSPQIRVFGIVRTNGSFSAYQFCDSRIYEYLIPTHCFLPPHPESFLGKQIVALAEEAGDREGFRERQSEVSTFWEDTEDKYIRPILEQMDPALRSLVMQAPYNPETKSTQQESSETNEGSNGKSHITLESGVNPKDNAAELAKMASIQQQDPPSVYPNDPEPGKNTNPTSSDTNEPTPFEAAIKSLRAAYLAAKHAYRIPPARLTRIRTALSHYLGTHNYHNYTISKPFRDASANRVIRTFTLAPTPLLINGTEWLSLKVHGQSFMMHQIRKMVSMAALVVRCGCNPVIMDSSFGPEKISIPKAPGLGLLLERPVFEAYNAKLERFGRDRIDFSIHENVMEEFKQREIYERIWREEEREHVFHGFFAAIDNLRSAQMLWVSSLGFEATRRAVGSEVEAVEEEGKKGVEDLSSDDDDDDDDGGAGDGDEG